MATVQAIRGYALDFRKVKCPKGHYCFECPYKDCVVSGKKLLNIEYYFRGNTDKGVINGNL